MLLPTHCVFPSTVRLWKTLYRNHGLQVADSQGLEEPVFRNFERILPENRGRAKADSVRTTFTSCDMKISRAIQYPK